MRVLVDTNVLLDVLADRKPFYTEAVRIWTLAESGRIDARVAAISFSNCYYLVRKQRDRRSAEMAIRLLREIFAVVDLTAGIISKAVDAGFNDFEDAVQYHSAIQAQAECIITRNPAHFPKDPISILTSLEFLTVHKFE